MRETKVYYLENVGANLFSGLINSNPIDLGVRPSLEVNNNPVIISEVLGVGSSSMVFLSEYKVTCHHLIQLNKFLE